MPKDLQTFNFDTTEIRVVHDDSGNPLFCLADVCSVLDIENSRNVVTRLDARGVYSMDTPTKSGTQPLTYVNEPNLYRVIFQSRKPSAQRFQDWIFEEVIPSIRKTGKYSMPGATPPTEPAITDARKEHVANLLELHFKVAELFNVPAHHAEAEAVKLLRKHAGEDFSNLLTHSPAQSNLAAEDIMLEPTELGEALGIGSGKQMNQVLARMGLQERVNGRWTATPEGEPYSAPHQWMKGDKTGVNLKWRLAGIRELIDAYGERLMQDNTH